MSRVTVYTCAIGPRDWIHRPRAKPAGIDFLRFSDRKPWNPRGWLHRDLPEIPGEHSARILSRFPKLRPQEALPPGYDIGIWIDSSIEVLGDIRPLIETFDASGADLALFAHPSGRSVVEEIDFAMAKGRIPPESYSAAEQQRQRYQALGIGDRKIIEATIIFHRLQSEASRKAGQIWWDEITTYTDRDQVSQPFAMRGEHLKIHLWDWHFDDPNPYFRRQPHRPHDLGRRLWVGAHCLGASRLDFFLVGRAIELASAIRRVGRTLLSRS
jgi:hypothetical protein